MCKSRQHRTKSKLRLNWMWLVNIMRRIKAYTTQIVRFRQFFGIFFFFFELTSTKVNQRFWANIKHIYAYIHIDCAALENPNHHYEYSSYGFYSFQAFCYRLCLTHFVIFRLEINLISEFFFLSFQLFAFTSFVTQSFTEDIFFLVIYSLIDLTIRL